MDYPRRDPEDGVNSLETNSRSGHKKRPSISPWYKTPAILISLVAVMFSMATTLYSNYRLRDQNIMNSRVELRQLTRRVYELGKEAIELESPTAIAQAKDTLREGMLHEQFIIAHQAADIAQSIGNNLSSPELIAVSLLLESVGNLQKSADLAEIARKTANNYVAERSALHVIGRVLMNLGQTGKAQARYQEALRLHEKYPEINSRLVKADNIQTLVNWATSELETRECEGLRARLDEIEGKIADADPRSEYMLSTFLVDADRFVRTECD